MTPRKKKPPARAGAAEPMPCAVCNHPRARDVLLDLAAGTATVAGAAAILRMPPREVRHHLTICDPDGLLDEELAAAEGPIITTANIERLVAEALAHTMGIIRGHPGTPTSPTLTVKAVAELRALLELGAKMTGAITAPGATAVAISGPGGSLAAVLAGDEFAALTTLVQDIHPEQRTAILERLDVLDAEEVGPEDAGL